MAEAVTIVMADDDPDDRVLFDEALDECGIGNPRAFVEDGEQLLAYLTRQGQFADLADTPLPGLVLLDLNMPRMDGREALRQIKQSPELRRLPVVVFSTTDATDDIAEVYELGGNTFVTKPASFRELTQTLDAIVGYWTRLARLPPLGAPRTPHPGRGAR